METVYNKEELQVHLELIKPAGYALESFENEFYFTRQEAQRKITVTPFYDEYFPHDAVFTGVSVSVLFYELEQILNNVYVNNPTTDFKHTLNKTNSFRKGFTSILSASDYEKLKSTKVSDDSSFYIVKPLLEQMVSAAVNFTIQNQTLQNFYNLGESMNEDDQLNFYVHPASFRMAIIKKLLNLPYSTFLAHEITLYNQHNMVEVASFALAACTSSQDG